jgi:DNA-binding GntR family transcriptional regulator
MSQSELCELLDVPVTPLRDAIRTLQAEGLVEILPRSGIRIPKPDTDLIRHTFQLRRILEREGVRQFLKVSSDDEIARWRLRHAELQDRIESGSLRQPELGDELTDVDKGFHTAIIGSLRNPIIDVFYRRNEEQILLIRVDQRYVLSPPLVRQTLEEHFAILASLEQRDEPAAIAAMERHMDMAMRRALGD